MAKPPPKLSGLIKSGAVVPATPVHELADIPEGFSVSIPSLVQTQATVVHNHTIVLRNTDKNLQQININLIDPNPLAPREIYTAEMILKRAEDLRLQGQHDPIHVIPHPQEAERFIICDGWTRVLACRDHKIYDSLLAQIHNELNLQQAAWFGYEQNEGRSPHCDLDRAMFYEKLIAAGETAAEISRRAKLSKTLLSFYRAYHKLPEAILEIIRLYPEKFGANVAYQLLKVYDALGVRPAVALAQKYTEEDQPFRWLSNQVQALLNPAPSKATGPTGRTIRYANGVYKQRGESFTLNLTVAPEHREFFAQGLERLLAVAAMPPAAQEPLTTQTT